MGILDCKHAQMMEWRDGLSATIVWNVKKKKPFRAVCFKHNLEKMFRKWKDVRYYTSLQSALSFCLGDSLNYLWH
ncbi:hypothetical protein KP509_1Z069700 [Ceratopteris richardii]|nr:hypothetical protein KP509_1Z069700 [Ceratopteris richardii]